MKTCLISLVSDQTIPNILVACDVEADFLLLVSTDAMEKRNKSVDIVKTLSLIGPTYGPETFDVINISEDSVLDFHEKVTDWLRRFRGEFTFVVNITGGTKLMSIAAYELFKTYDARIVYMPISQNAYFPVHRPEALTFIGLRLTVTQYFSAYGVTVKNWDELESSRSEAWQRKDLTFFIYDHYLELTSLLKTFGAVIRPIKESAFRKGYSLTFEHTIRNDSERVLLGRMGFSVENHMVSKSITKNERDYMRGGWLEERVFLAFETVLSERGGDVMLNVKSESRGNSNEFDVVFTMDNVLYVVECKSLDSPKGSEHHMGGTINDFIYKLGALRQDFGITPKAILATTSADILKNGEVNEAAIKRGKQFNVVLSALLKYPDMESHFRSILGI